MIDASALICQTPECKYYYLFENLPTCFTCSLLGLVPSERCLNYLNGTSRCVNIVTWGLFAAPGVLKVNSEQTIVELTYRMNLYFFRTDNCNSCTSCKPPFTNYQATIDVSTINEFLLTQHLNSYTFKNDVSCLDSNSIRVSQFKMGVYLTIGFIFSSFRILIIGSFGYVLYSAYFCRNKLENDHDVNLSLFLIFPKIEQQMHNEKIERVTQ
jgi:hypothetical protein